MDLPPLNIGICTYKRPWYAVQTILGYRDKLHYAGKKNFVIADGGSPDEDIAYYRQVLHGCDVTIEVTNNLASMYNSCARHGGDVWIAAVDDFVLHYPINITPDVLLLMQHQDIGVVRMGRLAHWGAGGTEQPNTYAELIELGGLHWWKIDKERTKDPYLCSIGTHLYHRRFWNAYGDIPVCAPNRPGDAELNGMARFNGVPGPTVAVPMRFGEESFEHREPFWHLGVWRTDDYASAVGTRF